MFDPQLHHTCRTLRDADCSVCTEGFSKSLAFTCTKCVDDHGGFAIMGVVGLFVLCAAVALCMHLVSGEMEGGRRGVVHRILAHLPFQSIKIVVVVWQILTQVRIFQIFFKAVLTSMASLLVFQVGILTIN